MNICRKSWWSKLLVLLAGITFLNMAFISAELDVLGLKAAVKTAQSVVNGTAEEEQETDSEDSESEMFFHLHQAFSHHHILYFIGTSHNSSLDNLEIRSPFLTTFSPPPEQSPLI